MEIKLNPGRIAGVLWKTLGVLVVLHFVACIPFFFFGRKYPFAPFNLNSEQNLPTLFAVLLLLSCCAMTACIAHVERINQNSFRHWAGLSAAFFFVGFDEFAELHEKLIFPLQALLDASGVFHYAWIIPYGLVLALFVAVYARFFFRLPERVRRLVLLGAGLYCGGAIGMEMIDGAWREAFGRGSIYYLMASIEEILELSGSIVFVYAFSSYIDSHLPDVRLRITSD
jgi:hypothetical protein